jgi:hypothetical protein
MGAASAKTPERRAPVALIPDVLIPVAVAAVATQP